MELRSETIPLAVARKAKEASLRKFFWAWLSACACADADCARASLSPVAESRDTKHRQSWKVPICASGSCSEARDVPAASSLLPFRAPWHACREYPDAAGGST